MRLMLSTPVHQPCQKVWQGFTADLFLALAPPFPLVKLQRFDGCQKGDEVHIELNFILFRQNWNSLIEEQQTLSHEIFFIDRGTKLPFFLKKWRHIHRIVKRGSESTIVDDIEFHSPFLLFDYLLYPILYLQFLYRKPIYKRLFA